MIVDAHLDIAFNALNGGRGFLGDPTPGYVVSRPALSAAGVGLVFPTLFAMPPSIHSRNVYRTPGEARLLALAQASYYRSVGLDLVRDRAELEAHLAGWLPGRLAGVLLMEGADPILEPGRLGEWAELGVRIVGPAWQRTRYCGGTGQPGGLTELGVALLGAMRRHRMILDLSHMALGAVRESFQIWRGPLMASHANARALVPGDRQLNDRTIAEIGRRGGVIGVSFFEKHLRPGGAAGLDDVVRHVRHIAAAAGGPEHVGLGTDLDGGFEASRSAVASYADLLELRGRLRPHFTHEQVEGIMGGNWIAFLRRSLPA